MPFELQTMFQEILFHAMPVSSLSREDVIPPRRVPSTPILIDEARLRFQAQGGLRLLDLTLSCPEQCSTPCVLPFPSIPTQYLSSLTTLRLRCMRHVSLQPPKSIYKSVHTLELGRVTFAESISLSRYFPALRNLEYKFDGSSQGKPAFEELGETVNSLPNGILDTFIIDTLMCNAIGMFGIKLFLDMLEINLSDIHGLDLPRVLGNLRLRTLRLRMTGGNAKRDLVLLDKAGSTGHGGPTRVVLITHGDCDMTNMDFVVSISRACRGLFRGITHFVWSVKGNPAAAISEGKGYGTHDLTISRKLKRLSLTNPSQPARKLDFGVLVERLMKHFPLPRFIYFDMCGESRAYWVINHFDDHPRSKSRKPQPLELHPVIGDFMLKKVGIQMCL